MMWLCRHICACSHDNDLLFSLINLCCLLSNLQVHLQAHQKFYLVKMIQHYDDFAHYYPTQIYRQMLVNVFLELWRGESYLIANKVLLLSFHVFHSNMLLIFSLVIIVHLYQLKYATFLIHFYNLYSMWYVFKFVL